MKHYAGLDLSMETTQVCIVDENGRKLASEKEENSPEAIAKWIVGEWEELNAWVCSTRTGEAGRLTG